MSSAATRADAISSSLITRIGVAANSSKVGKELHNLLDDNILEGSRRSFLFSNREVAATRRTVAFTPIHI
jgi:hypothetical protein